MLLLLASFGPDAMREIVGEDPVADESLAAGDGGAEAVELELEVEVGEGAFFAGVSSDQDFGRVGPGGGGWPDMLGVAEGVV